MLMIQAHDEQRTWAIHHQENIPDDLLSQSTHRVDVESSKRDVEKSVVPKREDVPTESYDRVKTVVTTGNCRFQVYQLRNPAWSGGLLRRNHGVHLESTRVCMGGCAGVNAMQCRVVPKKGVITYGRMNRLE